ncbi:MAG: hypothetical protein U1C57_00790 [Candidatus Doudnabacteria bacterium]|nr:hypothetical protein [bacterium]MDZ4243622.1 hypothetical protein [Candidatus Doudnabacteria bacterium]
MRSILKIFIILLILGLVLAGGYYFYWRPNHPQDERLMEDLATVKKPELLVSESVISPVLSFNAERVWFMTRGGRMYYQAIAGGAKEELPLPEVVVSPLQIIWQHRGSDFIIVQNVNGHIRHKLYDAEEQIFVAYPGQLRSPVFLAGDEKIAYDWAGATSSAHELQIAGLTSENFMKVMDLDPANYELAASPVRREVVMYAVGFEQSAPLLLVNVETGKVSEIGPAADYEGARFSPDGRFILVSRGGGEGEKLFMYNLDTSREIDLQTSASIEQTAWMPDSSGIVLASESGFGEYDLGAGKWQELYQFENKGQYEPTQILLHPAESVLFFVDEKTGFLYRLDLPR